MKNKLDHSIQFDMWRWSTIPEIRDSADFILNKICRNDVSGFRNDKLKNHLKVILTNLHVAHGKDTKLYVAVSLDKSKYKMSQRYAKLYLDYRYMAFLVRHLAEDGYIELHKGVHYGHFQRMSRIKATQKLLRLFKKYRGIGGVTIRRNLPVVLRNEAKQDIDFDPNTLELKTIIRNVNKINKYLGRHTIDVNIEDSREFTDFNADYLIYKDKVKYRRVFNNSDFGQGGRFYSHWSQNIKSRFRKYIRIDDMETVELDYSCLHLFMLFCMEGIMPPNGDLYRLQGIHPTWYRSYIKTAVNIIINAETRSKALKAICEEYRDYYNSTRVYPPRPTEVLEALSNTYPEIEKYFCSSAGVRLQNLDSRIAEKIMLNLAERDICCLCIHDSFIVAKEHQEELKSLMEKYFVDVFSVTPRIKVSSK